MEHPSTPVECIDFVNYECDRLRQLLTFAAIATSALAAANEATTAIDSEDKDRALEGLAVMLGSARDAVAAIDAAATKAFELTGSTERRDTR
jgi:hypothetical protein